jgi:hypothetical protein
MAKVKKYSKDELAKMSFEELKKVAKGLKINTAGKRAAALRREIAKAQLKAAGKGTAADPVKAKKGAKKAKEEDDDDEEDEEEEDDDDEDEDSSEEDEEEESEDDDEEEEADEDEEESDDEDDSDESELGVEDALRLLATAIVLLASKSKVKIDKKVAELASADSDDDEEEEDEEEESEDDDEEEEDADADEDDDEDEEEDAKGKKGKGSRDDSDDEDEDQVELSPKAVSEMNKERLKEVIEAVNEQSKAGINLEKIGHSPKLMRKALHDFIVKHANKGKKDDQLDPAAGKEGDTSWIKEGARAQAFYQGDWYKGTIDEVGKKDVEFNFDVDDAVSTIAFKDLKPLKQKK